MKRILGLMIIFVFSSCFGNVNSNKEEELILGYGDEILDLKEYENYTNIKKLVISERVIENFDVIYNFKELEVVEITGSVILDENAVIKEGNFKKLRELDISGTRDFTNLNIIKNSKNLEILNIGAVKNIENIDILKDFRKLKAVYLSDNLITDISPLKNSKNIEKLSFSNNLVKDISIVGEFKNLQYLGIAENEITDFAVARKLDKLEHLVLDKFHSKEEVKDILPKNLYENGKIDNEEYNKATITRIYTKMIL